MTSRGEPKRAGFDLGLVARMVERAELDLAMKDGATLLARETGGHAAVFLADGQEPLREYWSSGPDRPDAIRAAFKRAALEATRTGEPVETEAIDGGAVGRAIPLRSQGKILGAVCVGGSARDASPRDAEGSRVDALVAILAANAAMHEENARHRAQRVRDERWFKTLDGHLRVLDRERQKFAAVGNQTDAFLFTTDLTRTIQWTNRAMAELFPPEGGGTWIGKDCASFCESLGICGECPVTRTLEEGVVTHSEVRATIRGTRGLLYLTALPIRGHTGQVEEILVMIQDLTGLERTAEHALERAEERLQTVVSGCPIVLFAIDENGVFTLSEGKGLAALGLAPGVAVGVSVFSLYREHPEILGHVRRSLAGEEVETEVEVNGIWFEVRYSPRLDFEGKVQGIIGVATDITGRRRAEDALRRSEEQLREAQKMEAVGVLAGGVAHDFNNLLTVILTQSELLVRALPKDAAAHRHAEEIRAAGSRGAMLTRQLLTFSRNEVLAVQVLDLVLVLDDLRGTVQGLVGERVNLAWETGREPLLVRADRGQIEQAVLSLVVNAIEAMPDGGTLRVGLTRCALDEVGSRERDLDRPGLYAVLEVEDDGCGMDEATRGRVFEPFFTTKGAGRGSGLGLSTLYGIAKRNAGSVTLWSEAGRGSRFRVHLPMIERPEEAPRIESAPSLDLPRGTETVLLAEDEPAVRGVAKELLELQGYLVLEAANGADALELEARHKGPIHLLLTDVVMPRMGGRELAERFASRRPEARLLFVSGYTDDAALRESLRHRDTPFLQKPYALETLARAVREALDRRPSSPSRGEVGESRTRE